MGKFDGMTVNERLYQQGLIAQWDAAVVAADEPQLEKMLSKIDLASQAHGIVKAVLSKSSVPKQQC